MLEAIASSSEILGATRTVVRTTTTPNMAIDEETANFLGVGGIIAVVLSLIVAFALFFGFVNRKTEPAGGFGKWLKEFLNFRKMWMAGLMKFFYIFAASFITIAGIIMMFYGGSEPGLMVLAGFMTIIFGNIGVRLAYEMMMVFIGLWENTRDIRAVLVDGVEAVKKNGEKKEKKEKDTK